MARWYWWGSILPFTGTRGDDALQGDETIAAEIATLVPDVARAFGQLNESDWADIGQDVFLTVRGRLISRPELVQELATPEQLRRFIWTCLRNAAITVLRKPSRRRVQPLPSNDLLPGEHAADSSRLAVEDSRRILERVWDEAGPNARAVLEIVRRGISRADYADEHGLSLDTARVRFADGCEFLGPAIERAIGDEFGAAALEEFIAAVSVH